MSRCPGQLGAVALQHLGVIGHHRAVVVVVAQVLVQVVAHAGVEDGVDALLAQPLDMAVAQLGREAGRVAGDGVPGRSGTACGWRTGLTVTSKPSLVNKRMPEGQQLVHIQAQRDADVAARGSRRRGTAVRLNELAACRRRGPDPRCWPCRSPAYRSGCRR